MKRSPISAFISTRSAAAIARRIWPISKRSKPNGRPPIVGGESSSNQAAEYSIASVGLTVDPMLTQEHLVGRQMPDAIEIGIDFEMAKIVVAIFHGDAQFLDRLSRRTLHGQGAGQIVAGHAIVRHQATSRRSISSERSYRPLRASNSPKARSTKM